MLEIACVERLFALFISPDRAEGIAGDLAEERRARGASWFWLHVILTSVTLWRCALSSAPLTILGLAATGCAYFSAPAFIGVAAVCLWPQDIVSPVSWIALSSIWIGGALYTGGVLVRIAPAYGMAACVMLAAIGEALLVACGLNAMWNETLSTRFLALNATAMLAAMLVVVGGAIAHRRPSMNDRASRAGWGATSMIHLLITFLCLLQAVVTTASSQKVEWKNPYKCARGSRSDVHRGSQAHTDE